MKVIPCDHYVFLVRRAKDRLRRATIKREADRMFSTNDKDVMEGDTMIACGSAYEISLFMVMYDRTVFVCPKRQNKKEPCHVR